MRDNGYSNQFSGGIGEKWLDSGHILKIELMRLADGLDLGVRTIEVDSRIFISAVRRMDLAVQK